MKRVVDWYLINNCVHSRASPLNRIFVPPFMPFSTRATWTVRVAWSWDR